MLKRFDWERTATVIGVLLVILLLAGILILISQSAMEVNKMEWPFVLFLDLFVGGLPLLLTIGVFSIYRRSYLSQYPERGTQVAWRHYTLQMLLLIAVMIITAGALIWWDSRASEYFFSRPGVTPSLVPGRGSVPLLFSIGRDSESVRIPTAIFWWAYLGAVVSIINTIMRRFSVGHLGPRAYLNSALRLIYAFMAAALFYIAAQVWPQLIGRIDSDPMDSRYLLMLLSFLAGLFPITVTRWITGRLRDLLELDGRKALPLTEINGIDPEFMTYLNDEGIWTVVDLATSEPEVLAARLHLDPQLVGYWQSQASLLAELGELATVKHFRQLGVNNWNDLAALNHLQVDELTLDDWIQTPKDKTISPVFIHVLQEKARRMTMEKPSRGEKTHDQN